MASLTKVLKTDVMADLDLKALAQVIRAQGRGRDTVLAHITPREARMLKRQGGSGTINPATGLPEFQEMDDFGMYAEAPQQAFDAGGGYEAYAEPTPMLEPITTTQEVAAPPGFGVSVPEFGGAAPAAAAPQVAAAPQAVTPPAAASLQAAALDPRFSDPAVYGPPRPEEEGYLSRLGTSLGRSLQDPATLARLGLGLGVGGLGAMQQQRGARAASAARRQTADIGAPYRAQGQELIAQARAGELSPASMQAYQAAQAQIAQATARQGGVGAAQGAAQLERLRAQLLQNQYQLGLNVANIGDQYLRGAIQTGMQANQQLQTATQQFYSTMANVLAGPTGQAISTAARV